MSQRGATSIAFVIASTVTTAISHAGDLEHRHIMNVAAVMAAATGTTIPYPFISTIEGSREEGVFRDSAGLLVYSAPRSARSEYDKANLYDLTDFYKSSRLRSRIVLNMAEPYTQIYVSAGIDTGSNAPKLSVSKSYFLGLTRGFKLKSNQYLIASAGKWFGMRLSERPCLDSYDREYWCPALVAWADRPQVNQPKAESYLDVKYSILF